jgi:hypothetical protein
MTDHHRPLAGAPTVSTVSTSDDDTDGDYDIFDEAFDDEERRGGIGGQQDELQQWQHGMKMDRANEDDDDEEEEQFLDEIPNNETKNKNTNAAPTFHTTGTGPAHVGRSQEPSDDYGATYLPTAWSTTSPRRDVETQAEAFHDEIPHDDGDDDGRVGATRRSSRVGVADIAGFKSLLSKPASSFLTSSSSTGAPPDESVTADPLPEGDLLLLNLEPDGTKGGEDPFDDEIIIENEEEEEGRKGRSDYKASAATSKGKNGGKKSTKKKNGRKKDKKIEAIVYDDDDDDKLFLSRRDDGGDDDEPERFEDEIDDRVVKGLGGTTTDAPPVDHRHGVAELEASATGESSLALVLVEKDKNGVSLPPPDGLFTRNGSNKSSSQSILKKKFSKRRKQTGDRGSSAEGNSNGRQSWSRRVLSAISPLHGTAATPELEERQDRRRQDAFEDVVVFGDSIYKDDTTTSRYDRYDDDEESVPIRAVYDYDYENNRRPRYRMGLVSRNWRVLCIALCILLAFIALIVPLSLYIKEDRQEDSASSSTSSSSTALVQEGAPCVDMIRVVGNRTCFTQVSEIDIEFVQCYPHVHDWIGLFPANSANTGRLWRNYYDWVYVCGTEPCTNEELTQNLPLEGAFTVPPLLVGNYQIYLVLDSRWPYHYSAATEPFTVSSSCPGDGPA